MGSKNKVWIYGILPISIVVATMLLFWIVMKEVSPYLESKFVMIIDRGRAFYGEEMLVSVDSEVSVTTSKDDVAIVPEYGERYGFLKSSEISLTAPLYYGDNEEILQKGVGQYPNGIIPGQEGSIIIGGHDTSYFAALEQVEVGSRIELETKNNQYIYEVAKVEVMSLEDLATLSWNEDTKQMILYTCYPFGEVSGEREQRILYYCKPLEE